jgi:SpoVK/Ycf46/Vps4 family AAA+-type ATPase
MARALANSCSENGKQVSFFMRKGADCLSKWVGEAERQLRLLFEQARNMQPAIVSKTTRWERSDGATKT